MLLLSSLPALADCTRAGCRVQKRGQKENDPRHVQPAGLRVEVHGKVERGVAPFDVLRAVSLPNGMAAWGLHGARPFLLRWLPKV